MARMLNNDLVPRASYPWDEWCNGRPWSLVPGRDFSVSVATLRAIAQKAASRRGLRMVTEMKEGRLRIQAVAS